MNAHTPAPVGTELHRHAYTMISDQETPLAAIKSLCFALDAIASTPEVESLAADAIGSITTQIAQLVDQAEALRLQAGHLVHPAGYPRDQSSAHAVRVARPAPP